MGCIIRGIDSDSPALNIPNKIIGLPTKIGMKYDTELPSVMQYNSKQVTFAKDAHTKLKCYVSKVYFYTNKIQMQQPTVPIICETYENQSPLLGIISALQITESSIIVLGIDMPLITKKSIKNLIKHRNSDLLTTTYYHSDTNIWEPTLSIWEYETLPCLQTFFDQGGRSIQSFLNTFGNQRVTIIDKQEFKNIITR